MVRNILKYILLIAILLLLVTPAFAKNNSGARAKACYSNQRVIANALSEFSAKSDKNIASLVPDLNIKSVIGILRYNKYLDSFPENPCKECKLVLKNNLEEYEVYCEYHGNANGSVPPSEAYQKSLISHMPVISFKGMLVFLIIVIFLAYSIIRDFHNLAKEDASTSNKV